MAGLSGKALLAAIALVQLTRADRYVLPEGFRLAFDSEFIAYDWTLRDNETEVVYSRNVRPDRVFAYATYDQSQKRAFIQITKTNRTSPLRNDRCEFDFQVPDNSTVVIDSLRVYGYDKVYHAPFTWHVQGKKDDLHVDSVNIISCHHAEELRELKKRKLEKPKAVEMDLAKLEIPKRYHYVDKAHTDESAVRINYADESIDSVGLAVEIKGPPKSQARADSLNLDKYGVCWPEGKSVACAQGPMKARHNSAKLDKWATIALLQAADWIGVHNYAESRMLVLVGYCTSDNNCSYFELYEVRPDGKVIRHTTDHMVLGQCSKPSSITVDAFYDSARKRTCFCAVCLDGRQLKLRRKCAEESKMP